MKTQILKKYSIPAPRYTSYPPANFFNESFTANTYKEAIIASNNQKPEHISIYIHIPFCHKLCYYCGCNATILKNKQIVSNYIDAVKKEIQLVLPLLAKNRKISQIHYGGGSPTSQPIEVLEDLNKLILSYFDCIDNPEIAIECHPGYIDEAYWQSLSDIGFNRVSMGIQDFDERVLKTSNRKKSKLPVEDIVKWLKAKNISINMDFIYGLPVQTPESFSSSIEQAIKMQPDRVVTFSYAHVPWVNPLQNKLESIGLPNISSKNRMFDLAAERLTDAGYKTIGLDHFVLPDDELYFAKKENSLHRNFQGYCTRRTTGQVYAFGVTGISQLANSYSQNTKDLETYINQVNKGQLPVLKGYTLNSEEQIAREIISRLMCNYEVKWNELSLDMNLSKEDIKRAINYDTDILDQFAKDEVIEFDDNHIRVLPDSAPLVRNVAASFDKLMLNTEKKFSKSV